MRYSVDAKMAELKLFGFSGQRDGYICVRKKLDRERTQRQGKG